MSMSFSTTADKNYANVKIDRRYYRVDDAKWLYADLLREIAKCPTDHEIWEIVPGECDRKVEEYSSIPHVPNALRQFFTAPRHVNVARCILCVA